MSGAFNGQWLQGKEQECMLGLQVVSGLLS